MARRHPGWAALAEALAPGTRVTRMHRLVGGGSADAYDVTLDRAPGRVIVKVFRDGDDTAPLEWSRVKVAQRVAMLVPEPTVADLESTWFGRSAIVMSRLTGRPDVAPKDVDSWIGSLARALTELHYLAESLEVDRQLGHVPEYEVALAHFHEQFRRALIRLD